MVRVYCCQPKCHFVCCVRDKDIIYMDSVSKITVVSTFAYCMCSTTPSDFSSL